MTAEAPDLTHAEAREAFLKLSADFGPKCEINVSLQRRSQVKPGLLIAMIQPSGYGTGNPYFWAGADTYRELLTESAALLAEHVDLHATNTIREMALAIISITADQGECSDAALRATFDAADIARYGERACAQATEMASNGPFSIVKLSGANDAEAA